jgi:flagellar biogenesis protein FliO
MRWLCGTYRARCAALVLMALQAAAAPAMASSLTSSEDLPLGRSVQAAASADPQVESAPWLMQTLGALALVVALIVGVRLVLARVAGPTAAAGERLVELVARSSIAPRTQVLFLRVHQRIIIAAQTPQGMHTLAVLDRPDDVQWVLSQAKPRTFRQALHEHQSRQEPADLAQSKVAGLLDRLRDIKRRGGRP